MFTRRSLASNRVGVVLAVEGGGEVLGALVRDPVRSQRQPQRRTGTHCTRVYMHEWCDNEGENAGFGCTREYNGTGNNTMTEILFKETRP